LALDYKVIRQENERRYGTDIGRIGPMLLANRYDDRTHFLYELLQNAEDAVAEREEATERRSVHFQLTGQQLLVRHFGKLFDEKDARGISETSPRCFEFATDPSFQTKRLEPVRKTLPSFTTSSNAE
jgi:hypothetical protein